jgi:predicted alpha/beta-hydrolase family hydrolase
MRGWAKRLSAVGRVTRFDYPYQLAGRKLPDRLDVLLAAHLEALATAARRRRGPVVLAGKSMGSRIGCHAAVALAATDPEQVRALVCFGYPLRSPAGTMRDEVLLKLQTPILFVQGDRDPLCPLPLLEATRARMSAPNQLHVVEGGDHSLLTRAQKGADDAALAAVAAFLRSGVAR